MNVIYDPTVYLVGVQAVNDPELDAFLSDHEVETWETDTEIGAEKLPEVAGRLCYMSFSKPRPGGNQAYLQHIKESGHGSVLEHTVFNFIITGVSRTFTHELVRHRAGWGYSQLSQRYVDESVCEVVVPHDLLEEVTAARKWLCERLGVPEETQLTLELIESACDRATIPDGLRVWSGLLWLRNMARSSDDYKELTDYLSNKVKQKAYEQSCDDIAGSMNYPTGPGSIEDWFKLLPAEKKTEFRKTARQAARSVLPNATETKIFCTANARALRHFLEMRGSRFAEPEIRKVSFQLLQMLKEQAPALFGDYTAAPLPDGTYELTTVYRKV